MIYATRNVTKRHPCAELLADVTDTSSATFSDGVVDDVVQTYKPRTRRFNVHQHQHERFPAGMIKLAAAAFALVVAVTPYAGVAVAQQIDDPSRSVPSPDAVQTMSKPLLEALSKSNEVPNVSACMNKKPIDKRGRQYLKCTGTGFENYDGPSWTYEALGDKKDPSAPAKESFKVHGKASSANGDQNKYSGRIKAGKKGVFKGRITDKERRVDGTKQKIHFTCSGNNCLWDA